MKKKKSKCRKVNSLKEANIFSNKPMPKEIGISAITKKDVEEFVDEFYINYRNMMSKLSRE